MYLEVEPKLIIQKGWKWPFPESEVDKISTGAERILSEFIQNKNGGKECSSLTI